VLIFASKFFFYRRNWNCIIAKKMDNNGNKQGGEELERTYIGSRGETVIAYGIVNEEAWERVEESRIGEKVESGLLPLEISIRNEP
jgi:hypothetical protein